jgi:hypothetical protein
LGFGVLAGLLIVRRREFVGTALFGGAVGRAGVPQGPADGSGEERMTWPTGDGYEAPVATVENEVRWVQVDLGSSRKIGALKLYSRFNSSPPSGIGFPVRLRIDISDDPQFSRAPRPARVSAVVVQREALDALRTHA